MKKAITILVLLTSFTVFSQRRFDQYSLEADYGLSIATNPSIVNVTHLGLGFRYMFDGDWGVKIEYAQDTFRKGSSPELGTDYRRYSVQGVFNLGRAIDMRAHSDDLLNILAHGGLGYSSLHSEVRKGVDNIGHVIVGVTPQLKLNESLALTFDTSLILNFTQHFKYDGTRPNNSRPEAFLGKMVTASFGITYYFGRNGSNPDWR